MYSYGFKQEWTQIEDRREAERFRWKCLKDIMTYKYDDGTSTKAVEMVTTAQANIVWFVLRGLSFTSTSANEIVSILH